MEFKLKDLDKAITFYLTTNPDEPQSIYKIYNELCKSLCPELRNMRNRDSTKLRFQTTCRTLDVLQKNIKRMYKGDILYLIWASDNQNYDKEISVDNNYDEPLFDINVSNIEIVRYMLNNPDIYSDYGINMCLTEVDSPVHIICKNGDILLLRQLMDKFKIDLNARNRDGYTCLELAKKYKRLEIVEALLEYKYICTIDNLENRCVILEQDYLRLESAQNLLNKEICRKNVAIRALSWSLVSLAVPLLGVGLFFYFN